MPIVCESWHALTFWKVFTGWLIFWPFCLPVQTILRSSSMMYRLGPFLLLISFTSWLFSFVFLVEEFIMTILLQMKCIFLLPFCFSFLFSELWLQLLLALQFNRRSNLRVFLVVRTGWSSSLEVVRGRPHWLLEIWVWQLETAWVRRIFWSFWMVWLFRLILRRLRLQIQAFDLCNTWGF